MLAAKKRDEEILSKKLVTMRLRFDALELIKAPSAPNHCIQQMTSDTFQWNRSDKNQRSSFLLCPNRSLLVLFFFFVGANRL